jgi:gelsolin
VFILDNGLVLYQWNGKSAGQQEKVKGAQVAHAIHDERKGQAKVVVNEEGHEDAEFWKLLGGQGPVASAAQGGKDDGDDQRTGDKKLFKATEAGGKHEFKEVASGNAVKKNLLGTHGIFILDSGFEVYAWIGKAANQGDKKHALQFAQEYLTSHGKPAHLPVSRIYEGSENDVFEAHLR